MTVKMPRELRKQQQLEVNPQKVDTNKEQNQISAAQIPDPEEIQNKKDEAFKSYQHSMLTMPEKPGIPQHQTDKLQLDGT